MKEQSQNSTSEDILLEHFPPTGTGGGGIAADQSNPAIRLYGRRFYKDQTPIEYLAELLLVFASPKGENQNAVFSFKPESNDDLSCYWPEDRVALKLFAFFPSSKLETRHQVHQKAYLSTLEEIKSRVQVATDEEKEETVRMLQSLFSGFVGVAKDRTWVTHSFLPVSSSFLTREVTWNHPAAIRGTKGEVTDWDSSTEYFDSSTHNFLGRGGELLFLQLANLFSKDDLPDFDENVYSHLSDLELPSLCENIETGLKEILRDAVRPIVDIVDFVELSLTDYKLPTKKKNETRLGWIPSITRPEAFLFASELDNICSSTLSSLDKLDLLQQLCVMQVLRSLCFQARRIDENEENTEGFIGNYCWIVANPEADTKASTRTIAQRSVEHIEELLYRALRSPRLGQNGSIASPRDLKNGDDNCFRHFRKFAKEIGLVIPRTGRGQRFVLPLPLLRFLVAALIAPGERVRLTKFYSRVFAHYGIALGRRQLATALAWNGAESGVKDYAVAADTAWVEEALQQGGFLVELSDAVSIVHNPGNKEVRI